MNRSEGMLRPSEEARQLEAAIRRDLAEKLRGQGLSAAEVKVVLRAVRISVTPVPVCATPMGKEPN